MERTTDGSSDISRTEPNNMQQAESDNTTCVVFNLRTLGSGETYAEKIYLNPEDDIDQGPSRESSPLLHTSSHSFNRVRSKLKPPCKLIRSNTTMMPKYTKNVERPGQSGNQQRHVLNLETGGIQFRRKQHENEEEREERSKRHEKRFGFTRVDEENMISPLEGLYPAERGRGYGVQRYRISAFNEVARPTGTEEEARDESSNEPPNKKRKTMSSIIEDWECPDETSSSTANDKNKDRQVGKKDDFLGKPTRLDELYKKLTFKPAKSRKPRKPITKRTHIDRNKPRDLGPDWLCPKKRKIARQNTSKKTTSRRVEDPVSLSPIRGGNKNVVTVSHRRAENFGLSKERIEIQKIFKMEQLSCGEREAENNSEPRIEPTNSRPQLETNPDTADAARNIDSIEKEMSTQTEELENPLDELAVSDTVLVSYLEQEGDATQWTQSILYKHSENQNETQTVEENAYFPKPSTSVEQTNFECHDEWNKLELESNIKIDENSNSISSEEMELKICESADEIENTNDNSEHGDEAENANDNNTDGVSNVDHDPNAIEAVSNSQDNHEEILRPTTEGETGSEENNGEEISKSMEANKTGRKKRCMQKVSKNKVGEQKQLLWGGSSKVRTYQNKKRKEAQNTSSISITCSANSDDGAHHSPITGDNAQGTNQSERLTNSNTTVPTDNAPVDQRDSTNKKSRKRRVRYKTEVERLNEDLCFILLSNTRRSDEAFFRGCYKRPYFLRPPKKDAHICHSEPKRARKTRYNLRGPKSSSQNYNTERRNRENDSDDDQRNAESEEECQNQESDTNQRSQEADRQNDDDESNARTDANTEQRCASDEPERPTTSNLVRPSTSNDSHTGEEEEVPHVQNYHNSTVTPVVVIEKLDVNQLSRNLHDGAGTKKRFPKRKGQKRAKNVLQKNKQKRRLPSWKTSSEAKVYLERNVRKFQRLEYAVNKIPYVRNKLLEVTEHLPLRKFRKTLQVIVKNDSEYPEKGRRVKKAPVKNTGRAIRHTIEWLKCYRLLNYSFVRSQVEYTCKLCRLTTENITAHYKLAHRGSEVMISRLNRKEAATAVSAAMGEGIASEIQNDSGHARLQSPAYNCRMCNKDRMTRFRDFFIHVTTHTGEYTWACLVEDCHVTAPTYEIIENHIQNKHPSHDVSISAGRVEPFSNVSESGPLYGFICSRCNFVQIFRKNVEDHIKRTHTTNQKVSIIKINLSSDETSDHGYIFEHFGSLPDDREGLIDTQENDDCEVIPNDVEQPSEQRGDDHKTPLIPGPQDNSPEVVELDIDEQPDLGLNRNDDCDIKVECELGPFTRRKWVVGPLQAQKMDNSGILYDCLIKTCTFTTRVYSNFESHVRLMHSKTKWRGDCDSCEHQVGADDNLTLQNALEHMTLHTRQAIPVNWAVANENTLTRPELEYEEEQPEQEKKDYKTTNHKTACYFAHMCGPVSCPHCVRGFCDERCFVIRLPPHGIRQYFCNLCTFRSIFEASILEHMDSQHKWVATTTTPEERVQSGKHQNESGAE